MITLALSLLLLMNPLGNIPAFLTQLQGFNSKRQRLIILRELFIALGTLFFFMFLGQPLLSLLKIDHHTLLIAGGIILFIISIRLIFPQPKIIPTASAPKQEPLIVPLAIPLIAGPATLASIMVYAAQLPSLVPLTIAIVLAWATTTCVLIFAPTIARALGPRGILACERLMGLILILISIRMTLEGIRNFVTTLQ